MMILSLKCLLAGILLFLLFYVCSVPAERLFGFRLELLGERILFGFFLYFLLFEIVAVPLILLQQPFHVLCMLWSLILFAIVGYSLFFVIRRGAGRIAFFPEDGLLWDALLCLLAFFLVGGVMALTVFHKYIGWDPSYYLGTMNTTLATDTMYLYDGADGTPEKVINLRYALSAFYMQFTFWCRMLGIPVRIMAWWLVRPLCTALSALIVYLIGMELTERSPRRSFALLILWTGILLFWSDVHTTAYFMIVRGYEAKGYCSNVVIPMLLYGILCFFRRWPQAWVRAGAGVKPGTKPEPKPGTKSGTTPGFKPGAKLGTIPGVKPGEDGEDMGEAWRKLALISWASVAISMSAMALVPMGLAVMGTTMLFLAPKQWLSTAKGVMACALPNIAVVLVYLLHAKDILVIPVSLH